MNNKINSYLLNEILLTDKLDGNIIQWINVNKFMTNGYFTKLGNYLLNFENLRNNKLTINKSGCLANNRGEKWIGD